MTTDDSLHLFGTRLIHAVPGWIFTLVGLGLGELFGWWFLAGVGIGMQLVMLFGHLRAHAPHYRWRVETNDRAQLAMDRGRPFLLAGLITAAIVAVRVVIGLV